MGVVFKKTAKGQEEILQRQGGLSPRIRRLLILIDGQRTVEDLRGMVTMDDLSNALGSLEEAGLIAVDGLQQDDGLIAPPSDPMPPVDGFRELGIFPDKAELEKARNFMINTLRTFAGHYEHITLVHEIYSARDHLELRDIYGRWYRAVIETRDGKRRADELRVELLAVL